jgi:hypothetical protein
MAWTVRDAGLVILLATAGSGCQDWRERVRGGLAVKEPEQTLVATAAPTRALFPPRDEPDAPPSVPATLTPRARYRIRAWVVAKDRGFDDDAADVLTLDLGLAWGPVASPDLLRSLSFRLDTRYLSLRWSEALPLDGATLMRHVSNHHLVVPDAALRAYLDHAQVGDLVTLEGQLVDVTLEGTSGRVVRSSLSRDDIGNGACEVLWVERAQLERPWLEP